METDFAQLAHATYKLIEQSQYGDHLIYPSPQDLATAVKDLGLITSKNEDYNLEISQCGLKAQFFQVPMARQFCDAIVQLAQGVRCNVYPDDSFRWEPPVREGGPRQCRIGWGLFITEARSSFQFQGTVRDGIPPFSDPRFEFSLHDHFEGLSNYSYRFDWVDGHFQLNFRCHNKLTLGVAQKLFPDAVSQQVTGDSRSGYSLTVRIT